MGVVRLRPPVRGTRAAVDDDRFRRGERHERVGIRYRRGADAYTLTGRFSDGTTKVIGPGTGQGIPVTYSVSPAIATFDGFSTATATAGGTATVTAVATPDAGSPVTATATLHVDNPDTLPPTTVANVMPPPNGNGWNNANVSIALSTTDNAGGSGVASIVYSLAGAASGSAIVSGAAATVPVVNQGVSTLTYHAVDIAGNEEADKTLTISIDTAPPTQTVPGPIVAEATSPSGANVTFQVSSSDPLSGIDSTSISMPSGSMFPLGTTTVTYTATDRAGNIATTSFTVTVRDTTPPAIAPVASVTVEATSPSGAIVMFPLPAATDVVDPAPVVTAAPGSGSQFPIGTTMVLVTASDRSGNHATASFTVTVLSAAQMTTNLINATSSAGFQQGTSLLTNVFRWLHLLPGIFSPLSASATAPSRPASGGLIAACNQLQAFVNQTSAQSGKHLSAADAGAFALDAAHIAAAAGCSAR